MTRINSKDKGDRGERLAAKYLNSLGFTCRRGQQYCGGPDSPDVVGIPGVHIEVKFNVQGMDLGTKLLADAVQQSVDEMSHTEFPCVLWKQDRKPWRLSYYSNENDPMKRAIVTMAGDDDIRATLEFWRSDESTD